MSIESMCDVHSLTAVLYTETQGEDGGQVLAASTTTALTGRIRPLSAMDRMHLAQEGYRVDHVVYCSSDPSVDERYMLHYGSRKFEVKAVLDTDELGRLWLIYCLEQKPRAEG